MKEQDQHVFGGMQRDLSISKQKSEFLYDGLNVRLTAREGDQMLSLTNELGTEELLDIKGIYLGHCVIGDYLTVFTTNPEDEKPDYIYRVHKETAGDEVTYELKTLYNGNLGFSVDNPIETLGDYENEYIQKVYWVDGLNQPRFINIVKEKIDENYVYDDYSFDFVRELNLQETVSIYKTDDSAGEFPAGCIQYAFTYYNKYGAETNIAYTSPLYYTCFQDRAASPEEKVRTAFKVCMKNLDKNFDYVRLYSIFRTSIDDTPIVKRVADVNIKDLRVGVIDGGIINKNSKYAAVNADAPRYYVITDMAAGIYNDEEIANFDSYKKNVTPPGGTKGNYYVFSKDEFPRLAIMYISIKGGFNYAVHGEASTLYVSESAVYFNDSTTNIIIGDENIHTYSYIRSWSIPSINIDITDNGTIGDTVDPTSLLYIGGETVTASTLAQKDGTLFFGNLGIKKPAIPDSIKEEVRHFTVTCDTREVYCPPVFNDDYYRWFNSLNARDMKFQVGLGAIAYNSAGFKWREHYRLGLQFQYRDGSWSEPVFIKDEIQSKSPSANAARLTIPIFRCDIASIVDRLIDLGYKRVRTVAVFPSVNDRLVITQGLLCPTVYNVASRHNKTIYVQSSWFTRPFPAKTYADNLNKPTLNPNYTLETYNYDINPANDTIGIGSYVQYHHGRSLFGFRDRGAEIQGVPLELCGVETSSIVFNADNSHSKTIWIRADNNPASTSDYAYGESIGDVSILGNIFGVDQEFMTMHSPEIEFDSNIAAMDLSSLKCRRVGYVGFKGFFGDIDITTSTPTIGTSSTGFLKVPMSSGSKTEAKSGRGLIAGLFYSDFLVDDNASEGYSAYGYQDNDFLFMVYPWHKSGSLNNDIVRDGRSAKLKQKRISNIRFTDTTFFDYQDIKSASSEVEYGKLLIGTPKLFNSNEMSLIKVADYNGSDSYNYYGNVDSILVPPVNYGYVFEISTGATTVGSAANQQKGSPYFWDKAENFFFSSRWGTYKGSSWGNEEELIGDRNNSLRYGKDLIRMKYKSTPHIVLKLYKEDNMEKMDVSSKLGDYDRLYLAELYRDEADTDFGGTSEDALKSNLWIPVGNPVSMIKGEDSLNMAFDYGDTWYQRYDCLKTYPYTQEDENCIIDIVSFMCETRINIDGRYDKNRGQASNLYMSPTNFNLINPVYSQRNSFFNYRILDKDYYKLNNFPTTVTWSLQKTSASTVDPWTKVTLANTLDIDGSNGKIEALRTSGDNIYCFQERGISKISFNPRVQIPVSDGVPIEISNNYKVTGYIYIDDTLGCANKWSICDTATGISFVCSTNNQLYNLKDTQLTSISTNNGMDYWFGTIDNTYWKESNNSWSGVKSFYDFRNRDLYVVTKDTALGFSDTLDKFTSFYSYGSTEAMFNIGQDFYAIKNQKLWKLFSGDHNNFFGTTQPSSFTYVSNDKPNLDKIFSNLELRANFYNKEGNLCTYNFFDTLRVWNEYQDTEDVALSYSANTLSNVKRKFRIWGVNIPRDKKHSRDRIRNTWTKVKLDFTPTTDVERFELQDISTVYYT